MINGKLQEFVCNVAAKGQIRYGDVRRLQRDYLPGGITNREELELLTSANTKLFRADKAWTQWLVASVVEFIAKQEVREHPSKEAAGRMGRPPSCRVEHERWPQNRAEGTVRIGTATRHSINGVGSASSCRHTDLQCSAAVSPNTRTV